MSPVDPKQGSLVLEMVVVVQWKISAWAESAFLSLVKIGMETSPPLQQKAWLARGPSEAYEVFQWAVAFVKPVKALNQPELSWVMVWAGVMVELGPWGFVLCLGLMLN